MRLPRPSLARRITLAFFFGNAAAMLLLLLTLYPAALLDEDEPIGPELAVLAAVQDIVPSARGTLAIRRDGVTSRLAERHPGMWFTARRGRNELRFGPVPAEAMLALGRLPSGVREARFRSLGSSGQGGEAIVTQTETPAGPAIIAGGGVFTAAVTSADFLFYMTANEFWWIPLLAALLALGGAMLVSPILLRGLRPTVAAAAAIQPGDVRKRLPVKGVVKELLPLVQAFNVALDTLAAAFEQRERFIADVAHELRTPLAVLTLRVESMPDADMKPDIQRAVYRLSHMVGQMLDAERLALRGRRREAVDLVELARGAIADVAPLAVTQGYEMGFSSDSEKVIVNADPDAIARALANLLGNAVAHGGGTGTIEVEVRSDHTLDVTDQGRGVPFEARERIFEPFHRERWDRDGCGLGLHLVREIMKAHEGEASVIGCNQGARFRLRFPPLSTM